MSRAINIKASEAEIAATCKRLGLGVSMIEPLASGGVRAVLNNAADTASLTRAYQTKLLTGPVVRTATRLNRGLRGETRPSGR